jgi:lipopolysaccharide/colanic/teichoic acid biosynthesis glycosyltransferase
MYSIKNFFYGFISIILGFILSPQFVVTDPIKDCVIHISVCASVIATSLSVVGTINGHDSRMMMRSRVGFIVNLIVSAIIGVLIGVAIIHLARFEPIGRWVVAITLSFYVVLAFVHAYFQCVILGVKTYVFGSGAQSFRDIVDQCGFNSDDYIFNNEDFLSGRDDYLQVSKSFSKKGRLFIIPSTSRFLQITDLLHELPVYYRESLVSLDFLVERELECVNIDSVSLRYWWEVSTPLRNERYSTIKRVIDILIIIILFIPTLLIVGVAGLVVKISDGGPVFYRQIRLGQFGQHFSIVKLRTMRVDSESTGAQWAQIGDSRVTTIGRFLRATRVDELPQVWNVFRGEMSFIGPRPERPEFYKVIVEKVPSFGLRLACKPGLTGWAQVNFPYGSSVRDSRIKLMFDLFYIKNASVMLDIKIITRTVLAMVRGAR